MVAFVGKTNWFKECIKKYGTKYQDKVLIVEVSDDAKVFIKQNM
jgi:hypothetical protein